MLKPVKASRAQPPSFSSHEFRAALVWVRLPASSHAAHCTQGTSTKHNPQRVGLTHVLEDEDVVQIVKK